MKRGCNYFSEEEEKGPGGGGVVGVTHQGRFCSVFNSERSFGFALLGTTLHSKRIEQWGPQGKALSGF